MLEHVFKSPQRYITISVVAPITRQLGAILLRKPVKKWTLLLLNGVQCAGVAAAEWLATLCNGTRLVLEVNVQIRELQNAQDRGVGFWVRVSAAKWGLGDWGQRQVPMKRRISDGLALQKSGAQL